MITDEQLAAVIRDNIEPGREGPLGDLYLDCASAVIAAIEDDTIEPSFRGPDTDAIDAARFRFIAQNLVQRWETSRPVPGDTTTYFEVVLAMPKVVITDHPTFATSADALIFWLDRVMSPASAKPSAASEPLFGAYDQDPLTGALGIFECAECKCRFYWMVNKTAAICPKCGTDHPAWRRLPNAEYSGPQYLYNHRLAPDPPRSGMSPEGRRTVHADGVLPPCVITNQRGEVEGIGPASAPRPGMSPDERELLKLVAVVLAGQLPSSVFQLTQPDGRYHINGDALRTQIHEFIERIKP